MLLLTALILAASPYPDLPMRPAFTVTVGNQHLGGLEATVHNYFVRIEAGVAWTWEALSRGPSEVTGYARAGAFLPIYDIPTQYGVHWKGQLALLVEARLMNGF